MSENQTLAQSVGDLINQISTAKEKRTFLFADLHNSTEYKLTHTDLEWVPTWGKFYFICATKVERHEGDIIKFIGDGVMAVFPKAGCALQAAIEIQEQIEEEIRNNKWGLRVKIGIATGDAYGYRTADGRADYLGTTVDIAARLCELARGNAILLSSTTYLGADANEVYSSAGRTLKRDAEEYFGDKRATNSLKGIKETIKYYSLFWQAHKEYTDDEPASETKGPGDSTGHASRPDPPLPPRGERTRGIVVRRRGTFGFIAYRPEGQQQEVEAFFQDGWVLGEDAPQERDIVYFIPHLSDGGKLQAHSIVLLDSRLVGILQNFKSDGYGFISVKDVKSGEAISFFTHNTDVSAGLHNGDEVEFTVSENKRGLTAIEVDPAAAAA
ncbi:MAG: adenylate/guanylate cyclase domain-containing protein [Thermodesulfobacteriota bacterium]